PPPTWAGCCAAWTSRSPGSPPGCRSAETWSTRTRSPSAAPSKDAGGSMPEDQQPATEIGDLQSLAGAMAAESERFVETLTEVAAGSHPEAAMSLLLLAVADLTAAGARLGAVVDVVPPQRFEPDDGEEPDADPLRQGLANVLEGLDEYREVADPLVDNVSVTGSLSA